MTHATPEKRETGTGTEGASLRWKPCATPAGIPYLQADPEGEVVFWFEMEKALRERNEARERVKELEAKIRAGKPPIYEIEFPTKVIEAITPQGASDAHE